MKRFRPAGETSRNGSPVRRLRHVLYRIVLFAVLWWVMSEGELHHLLPAGLIVAAAATASILLVPPGTWRMRPAVLPRFLPFFFHQSFVGGVDVAGRALNPRLPLAPAVMEFRMTLERPSARIFFLWVVSLLPGTASVSLHGSTALVHVLDARQPQEERLQELERRIAALFGEEPSRSSGQ